jgi:hypothetical protein
MVKTRTLVAALAAAAAFAALAGPAHAITTPQVVTASPDNYLAVGVATPVVYLSNFRPGASATGAGAVAVTSTQAWTLKVHDGAASNPGTLAKAGAAIDPLTGTPVAGAVCPATSAAKTANQLNISGAGVLGTTTAGAGGAIGGALAPATVASGLFTDTISTSFSLLVGAGELLSSGCAYSATLTYTLQ